MYEDGTVMGELSVPDMRLPIQYALYYPHRPALSGQRLDLFSVSQLTFERPDETVFKGLALAKAVGRRGGNLPTAFNAADEVAVDLFLRGEIGFTEIPEMIEKAVDETAFIADPSVDDIEATEAAIRRKQT